MNFISSVFVNKIILLAIFTLNSIVFADWIDHSFPVMGTEVTVRFYLTDADKSEKAKQAVIDEMHRIDAAMSPYKEDSLLTKINNQASEKPIKISQELFRLIQQSNTISEMTKGSFDITFSSVGYLYDYRLKQKPTDAQLTEKLPLINYKSIVLNTEHQTIFYKHKGVKIDLGGIAKGLAVDNSINILKKYGVKEASVTAGGDTYVLGDNDGKMWRIGIKHPRAESKLVSILPLADTAVSTSGDYERFFIEDGKRYHHIINPSTGKSITAIQSVTILAANSTFADALSTSVFVLGVEKGLSLVESLNNISVIIVDGHGKMFYSSDLTQPE
jgi:thiamine biosynthesis lipoprotein